MGALEAQIAGFITTFPGDSIPAGIMAEAKRCIVNYCGVALNAAKDPSSDIFVQLFAQEEAKPMASIIGKSLRTTARNAALANGYLGHFDDFDDTHMSSHIHPTSPILPAVLALAECGPVKGADLVAAFVIGVEIACRLGKLISAHALPGAEYWHPTTTYGVLGAAAAAGRLLGLNQEQMIYALGIAGTQAAGLRLSSGSMCKPLHAGMSAQNGLFSALLAQRGFTASDRMFESHRGIIGVMTTEHDHSLLATGLGEEWELSNVGLKPYSCGIVTHGLIDSMLELREKGVAPDSVEHIQGTARRLAASLTERRHPEIGLQGKFSYYHVMAAALVDGQVLPAQFTNERVRDPSLAAVRDRIELSTDETLAADAARAVVRLTEGRTYTIDVPHQTGSPANPMTDRQVGQKFKGLADGVLPPAQAERALEALWDIDRLTNAGDVVPLLAVAG
ncbi:MAG TPA: MmgE/PrpD family protein [Chloroflexota bacterium]